MVALMKPKVDDVICDPAYGTGGFLVANGEYLRDKHKEAIFFNKHKKAFYFPNCKKTMFNTDNQNESTT